jgi:sorbitol/mannitol transport system substrate-binding protein
LKKTRKENQRKILPKGEKRENVNNALSFMDQRINRRQAMSTTAKVVIGAGAALIVGAAGTAAYYGTRPPEVISRTTTNTLTNTLTTVSAERDYYYDPSLAGTTITRLAANVPETPFAQELAPLFTQETGINVNFIVEPEDTVVAKAGVAFAAQSSDYDMVDGPGFGGVAFPWFVSGYLEPLTSYIQKTPNAWKYDDIIPVVPQLQSYKGDVFAFPSLGGVVNYPYFYRTDLIPQPAKTIDDMINFAKSNNNPPSVYGWTSGGTPDIYSFFTFDMFLWAEGLDYFDDKFHPQLNTSGGVDALTKLVQIAKYAPAYTTTTADDAANNFAQGRTAQLTDFWTWYKLVTAQGSQVSGKVGYAPHPGIISQPHMLASETFSISKFSKNKDAAWSFMSFLLSPRIAQIVFGEGYGSTMRKTVLDNPVNKQQHPDDIQVMDWLINAKPAGSGAPVVAGSILPHIPQGTDFIDIVVKAISSALAGTSAQDAMNTAQDKATQLMKDVGLYQP